MAYSQTDGRNAGAITRTQVVVVQQRVLERPETQLSDNIILPINQIYQIYSISQDGTARNWSLPIC